MELKDIVMSIFGLSAIGLFGATISCPDGWACMGFIYMAWIAPTVFLGGGLLIIFVGSLFASIESMVKIIIAVWRFIKR